MPTEADALAVSHLGGGGVEGGEPGAPDSRADQNQRSAKRTEQGRPQRSEQHSPAGRSGQRRRGTGRSQGEPERDTANRDLPWTPNEAARSIAKPGQGTALA